MIAIKDMGMPTECEYCGFCRYYPENGNVWCNAKNKILKLHWKDANWTHLDVDRPDWCPLIEIKTDGDTISRQAAIDALDCINGTEEVLRSLPSTQPERAKRIIGKSRDGMTMWYQCESCNEPVDEKDLFCSGCGRRFEDG